MVEKKSQKMIQYQGQVKTVTTSNLFPRMSYQLHPLEFDLLEDVIKENHF